MKNSWFPLAAALVLAGCSNDATLDMLIPATSVAVVVVDRPGFVAEVLGQAPSLPWKSLDGNATWAAAVLPGSPPGFLLAFALSDSSSAWPTVQAWAQSGGLGAARFGKYAVLTSPGSPVPAILDPYLRFDLGKVRSGGEPVALYVDMKNLEATSLPSALQPASAVLPWIRQNLSGLRLGVSARDGGLELRLNTDWKEGSEVSSFLKTWPGPADLSLWTARFPAQGLGVAASVPTALWQQLAIPDASLQRRWEALAPLLGPRLAVWVAPRADGSWSWAAALETRDPQAIRQAVKTLVAGGEIQKHFAEWGLDVDTPLIYQDGPDSLGGVRTQILWGPSAFYLGYGADRVALAGGTGATEALGAWQRPAASAPTWFREAPVEASLLATGMFSGLGGRAALRVLSDGNVESRFWVDANGLKSWEERLGRAIPAWTPAKAGSTRP